MNSIRHNRPFPHIVECDDGSKERPVTDALSGIHPELMSHAYHFGAVLLRGFRVPSVKSFDEFIVGLDLDNFPYAESFSNAVRINRTSRVFSANEAPSDVQILFHHEMAQTPLFPKRILFYCEKAPDSGGATPLCRSDWLLERLRNEQPAFVRDCLEKGVRYSSVMPGDDDPTSGMGRSWRSTFAVDNQTEVEARLTKLGYEWHWASNGDLRVTTPRLPAIMQLDDGRETFFNQLIAAFKGWKDSRNDPSDAIRYGDGSKLDSAVICTASDLADELAYDHNWQEGDILIVDNRITMHARRPFEGQRRILASLTGKQTNEF